MLTKPKVAVTVVVAFLSGCFLGRFGHAGHPEPGAVDARVAVLEQQLRRAETLRQATEVECKAKLYRALVHERVRLTGKTNPPTMQR